MTAVCALCDREAQLCKSHILSEFLYKKCYSDSNRMLSIPGSPDLNPRLVQKGFWRPLLCWDCEQKLGKHENYMADLMLGIHEDPTPAERMLTVQGYDYAHLKLFAMSILWRCAASRHKIYNLVSLGPHEARMKAMLRAGDPGAPQDYAMFLTKRSGSPILERMLLPPRPYRFGGMWSYRTTAMAIDLLVTVSKRFHVPSSLWPLFVGADRDVLKVLVVLETDESVVREFRRDMGPAEEGLTSPFLRGLLSPAPIGFSAIRSEWLGSTGRKS